VTLDEGYIKFDIDWTPGPAPDPAAARRLDAWRRPLHAAGLIGLYEDLGIGFGNLSERCGEPGQFLISGTQTGGIADTDERHYALVTAVDIDANAVSCTGPVKASSEAMTHAALYALDTRIGAVVHVHSRALWEQYLDVLPTTDPEVSYGTPAMAREFARLYAETGFGTTGIAVMGGHEEGLVSVGPTLEAAAKRMLGLAPPKEPEAG
jgi:ribulose-5-phosphate 4-epimerase/fuculose-1-phosphate aldolase